MPWPLGFDFPAIVVSQLNGSVETGTDILPPGFGAPCDVAADGATPPAQPVYLNGFVWPRTPSAGWWEPAVNLVGCVLFGVSAVAGYLVPSRGTILDLAAANWTTALGAACFLACAIASLLTGETSKLLHGSRISAWEHEAVAEAGKGVAEVERLL